MSELRVQQLKKTIGTFRVEADFSVSAQERVALLGASGGGKTTLLRAIAGLESIDSGELTLGGVKLDALPVEKREIGFVFQDQALFSMLSVLENVAFGLEMRGVAKSARESQATVWLGKVGMADRIKTPVSKLSGGERQRLALVRAFIWKPKLVLMDEPFSALDAGLRQTLRSLVVELHREHPVPLLFVTHDAEEATAMGTSAIRMTQSTNSNAGISIRGFVREMP